MKLGPKVRQGTHILMGGEIDQEEFRARVKVGIKFGFLDIFGAGDAKNPILTGLYLSY